MLDTEQNWNRKKKETINIQRGKPVFNINIGQELPPVMLQLISHDASHVTLLRKFIPLKKSVRNVRYIRKKKKCLER